MPLQSARSRQPDAAAPAKRSRRPRAAQLPDRYPLALDVERYIADEQGLGRLLDYAVIVPRLPHLYAWSAEELGEPRLRELARDGNPVYAWPFERRDVWRTPTVPLSGRVLARATRAR